MNTYVLKNNHNETLAVRFSLEEAEHDISNLKHLHNGFAVEVFNPESNDTFDCFKGSTIIWNSLSNDWATLSGDKS
tara:strand:- start:3437 stop:3664 length:228 start_codon:yes stop_codon:yes gene_type:complete